VIINNLEIHLDIHPDSRATRLLVKEGIRSNLTCPLMVQDKVTGFIFFSSLQPYIYMDTHIEVFSQIAGELARTLEKSRAYEDLCLRNEFIRKVFGQYVTNEVAEAVLSSDSALALGGDRRKVTVLMADLRGFTAMSEERTPEDVVDALNIYLGTMANVVMKYGGSVDNFIGDAIMAVFGAPITKPDDTARAIACAVEMQNSMDAVNTEIEGRGLSKLIMGIGVSTGEVIAGNIGSEARIKYSVIGSTVNLAARIEGITSGGQIFCCCGHLRRDSRYRQHRWTPERETQGIESAGTDLRDHRHWWRLRCL
jgi:class 3 adenylate cyclase